MWQFCGLRRRWGLGKRADAACHSCVKSCGRFKCQTWWSGWQPCQFERAMVGWLSGCLSVQLAAPLHTQAKWIVGSDRRGQAAQFGCGCQEEKLCKRKNNERPFFGKHAELKTIWSSGVQTTWDLLDVQRLQECVTDNSCEGYFLGCCLCGPASKEATHQEGDSGMLFTGLLVFLSTPPPPSKTYSVFVCGGAFVRSTNS